MNWIKNFGVAAVATLAIASLGVAKADIVTAASPSLTVVATCSTITCAGADTTLSASLTFSNFTFTNVGTTTTFTTQITVTNTTVGGTSSDRLTAFGFNTVPDATGGSDTSAVFNTFLETTFPSFQIVDVCESSGPTCAGGSNGGLSPGGTDTFTLSLTGLPLNTTSIDLGTDVAGGPESFDFKFQTANGSFEFGSGPPTTVPEPASLAIFGTGLIAMGAMRRLRRRRKS